MTIGEKIAKNRNELGLSQEAFAEKISVSRQAVSKWEMDQALPQIEKIMSICKLFSISADDLLDTTSDNKQPKKERKKYFGTDGFRGEANKELTSIHAYKIGRFLGWYFSSELSGCKKANYRPRIVVGKDTRRSSYMLEYSIAAGITASGADAYMLHVTTTPSVSFVARQDEFDCGIMITASHNPFYDNGIKVINKYGEKINDEVTSLIEAYLDNDLEALGIACSDLPFAKKEKIGSIIDYVAGRNRYLGYLISIASHSYKNLKIGLDCANGASWMLANSLFSALGAQTYLTGVSPDGLNVNQGCGSTHIENLIKLVKENHLDVGFAFDGDADRCIAIDESGNVVDGDAILFILGQRLYERGILNNNTIVATIMSNSGLIESLEKEGINCVQTTVGDRFVYECMQENDYCLGGEQSGHIILKKYATTGDGLLTAIMLAEEMCERKKSLAELCSPLVLYPQYTKSVYVKSKKDATSDEVVIKTVELIREKINGRGRVLIRESGTEPVIRVMVEAETSEKAEAFTNEIIDTIIKRGHGIEK